MEQLLLDDVQYSFRNDYLTSSRALVVSDEVVNTPKEISHMFDGITYQKVQCIG